MSPKAKLTAEMFRSLLRERDVVSFSDAMDRRGHLLLLKFALKNGDSEVIFLPSTVALFLRDCVRASLEKRGRDDQRRKTGDQRPEIPAISEFLKSQPSFVDADWDAAGGQPRQAIGLEVHDFDGATFIGFQVGAALYKTLRFPPEIMFYLVEMIDGAERDGLVDLGKQTQGPQAKN